MPYNMDSSVSTYSKSLYMNPKAAEDDEFGELSEGG